VIVRDGFDKKGRRRQAWFSDCERYRYWLKIEAAPGPGSTCLFVMCNPSTATETASDKTVDKCCLLALRWGFTVVGVANIFAWRSTYPVDLYDLDDPVGPLNDVTISHAAAEAGMVVAAWSQHGELRHRGAQVRKLLGGSELHYLRMGKNDQPWHPLYLPNGIQPVRWT
jgi:hypothetical protein